MSRIITLCIIISFYNSTGVYVGLAAFCVTGILVRLAMLMSCFSLIGKHILPKVFYGVLILAVSTAIGFALRYLVFS